MQTANSDNGHCMVSFEGEESAAFSCRGNSPENEDPSVFQILIRKVRSAGIRWRQYRERQIRRACQQQKLRLAKDWLHRFAMSDAEVLIGANFVELGGCRQHMHSLAEFSALKTSLVPEQKTVDQLSPFDLTPVYQQFLNTPPSATIKAVHSHVFPWFGKWCTQQRDRIPVWVHTHHNWYYKEFGGGEEVPWHNEFNQYFRDALLQCDVPLVVSRGQQKFLKEEQGIHANYLPNGVDLSLCLRGNADSFRRSTDLQQPFVLWVGRNDPVKNPVEVIHLAQRMPETKFCLIGPGLSAETLLSDYQIAAPDNVVFTGGVPQATVQDAIAACSALVVTSLREGFPTLVLEGLAHQKPIVVPTEAGCEEALGGPEFGWIYQLGNVDSLLEKTQAALNGPPLNPRSLERVRDEFDWKVIMRKLDRIYRGEDVF